MSAPPRSSTPAGTASRRTPATSQSSSPNPARSPTRMASRNTAASTGGVSRTRSVRNGGANTPISARSAVKKPTVASSGATIQTNAANVENENEEANREQTSSIIEDLQGRLQQAEESAEEYQKQVSVLQARLDDTVNDQERLEYTLHEHQRQVEELENENKERLRQRRELESAHEQDKASATKQSEEARLREEDLVDTVQRLKQSLAQRDLRVGLEDERRPSLSRTSSLRSQASPNLEVGHFAPSSSLQRSDSQSSSRLVLQKDKIIESLRLELAEAQIKLVEMENMGGGHVQELEKTLMETRMLNARLMEDNDSFQLLLSEKTLNGDLVHSDLLRSHSATGSPPPSRRAHRSSLADELDNTSENGEDTRRRSQAEIASLKDQNKALTLYINNIVSRLLQHSEFENILQKNPDLMTGADPSAARPADANIEKDLPLPPQESDAQTPTATSFLQRTKSMMGGRGRPRPISQISSSQQSYQPSANEDPATAPRIPLSRGQQRSVSGGHRRSRSDWASASTSGPLYRGPSPGASAPLSPSVASPPGGGFWSGSGTPRPSSGGRVLSGTTIPTISESERSVNRAQRDSKIDDSRHSVVSDPEGANSPPHSTTSSGDRPSAAIMGGNKMRPLRLVQEAKDEEAAKKAANRVTWMGWFGKGGNPPAGSLSVPGRSRSRERMESI